MNKRIGLMSWALLIMLAEPSTGQRPVITSLQGDGQISWTNAVNSNAVYRVERTAQLSLPFSFPAATELAGGRSVFTVTDAVDAASAFYRVAMHTNWPSGMVWIDGGDVGLGQTGVAYPERTYFVSGFWMDTTEVTKAEWDTVASWAASNGYDITEAGGLGRSSNVPVQTVDWYECVKWCNARSQKEGLSPCYYVGPSFTPGNLYMTSQVNVSNNWVDWSATGYRLPTEAEWEKAARGGRQRRWFPWGGDTISHSQANYFSTNTYPYDISPTRGYHPIYTNTPKPYTSPVGSFPANGYGLYDMAGNVWEWCWDWYGDYPATYQIDPHGQVVGQYGVLRIERGGAWDYYANGTRCAPRMPAGPNGATYSHGFRCVRGRPAALAFGINASVSVVHQAALNAYPLTVTAWLRTSQNDTSERGVVSKVASVMTNGYALVVSGGHILAAYARSSTQYILNGTRPLDGGAVADGNWHHVAFVVDASGGKIFLDGQLGDSQPWTGTPGACTLGRNLLMGRYSSYSLLGVVDEVAVWNTARSAEQIQASMYHSLTGAEAGLVGYWRLDEGVGLTAANSAATGASYNGTLQNGPTWAVSGAPFEP